jgi:drug/metabolite transporter (DMT)-like permease
MSGFGTGLLSALGAVVIFGAQLPVAKSAYAFLDPFTLSAIRYGAALLLLLGLLVFREGAGALSLGRRPGRIALAGLLGMAGSPLLVFAGLMYTLPEHAVIILALQPSMTALAQWRLHGKRPARFAIGSILVAFAGVVLVVATPGARAGDSKLLGDFLVISGAACWITYTMMLSGFPEFGALRFTALSCLFGTLGIVAFTIFALFAGIARMPEADALVEVAPHLAFLSLMGVVLAMLLWNYGNARIGPLNSMLLLNLMPVETYLIRYMQGARFGWHEWVGAAMVVGALVANNVYQRRST